LVLVGEEAKAGTYLTNNTLSLVPEKIQMYNDDLEKENRANLSYTLIATPINATSSAIGMDAVERKVRNLHIIKICCILSN
jgi:hypothetical protein